MFVYLLAYCPCFSVPVTFAPLLLSFQAYFYTPARMCRPNNAYEHVLLYGMVWYGMVWYGMVWYGTVRYGTVRYGTVRYGTVRYGLIQYGMI